MKFDLQSGCLDSEGSPSFVTVSGAPLFCHMCIKHLHMSCQVFSFGHLARNMFRHTSLFAIEKWSVPALPVRNVFIASGAGRPGLEHLPGALLPGPTTRLSIRGVAS